MQIFRSSHEDSDLLSWGLGLNYYQAAPVIWDGWLFDRHKDFVKTKHGFFKSQYPIKLRALSIKTNKIKYSFAISCFVFGFLEFFFMFCYTPKFIHLSNSLAYLLNSNITQNHRAIRSNNKQILNLTSPVICHSLEQNPKEASLKEGRKDKSRGR